MTQCIHNKTGCERQPGSYMIHKDEGDCYDCERDSDNKKCRRFYPAKVQVLEVKMGARDKKRKKKTRKRKVADSKRMHKSVIRELGAIWEEE